MTLTLLLWLYNRVVEKLEVNEKYKQTNKFMTLYSM